MSRAFIHNIQKSYITVTRAVLFSAYNRLAEDKSQDISYKRRQFETIDFTLHKFLHTILLQLYAE